MQLPPPVHLILRNLQLLLAETHNRTEPGLMRIAAEHAVDQDPFYDDDEEGDRDDEFSEDEDDLTDEDEDDEDEDENEENRDPESDDEEE